MCYYSAIEFFKFGFGIEWVLRCKTTEPESLRGIVRRLGRVVVLSPRYVLFALQTHSPKGHLNIYTTFVRLSSSVEGKELLEIVKSEILNFF